MIVLHAVTPNTEQAKTLLACQSSPLAPFVIECDDLLAITSSLDDGSLDLFEVPEKVTEFALLHNELLVNLSGEIDVLPVRLGAIHTSSDAVAKHVSDSRNLFVEMLEQTGNAFEITVELVEAETAPAVHVTEKPASGRDYLRAKSSMKKMQKAQNSIRQDFVDLLMNGLSPFSRKAVVSAQNGGKLSFLVERTSVSAFTNTISELEKTADDNGYSISATGPWPPYSFMEQAS